MGRHLPRVRSDPRRRRPAPRLFQDPGAAPLELTGQVRGAGGEPVANARVALRGDNFYSTTADADGFYSLQDLPSGTYEATVSAVCYEPQTQTVDLSQSRTVNFTLAKQSDAFGHTCAPEATPFEQADTLVPLTGDDIATTIDLPFPFTFYGETYNRAHLCTNGFIEFVGPTTTNCSGFNAAIPTTARPNGQIAAFWDDLVIDAEASIRADARGSAPDRRFVVEFRNVQFFNDATRGASTSTSSCSRTARSSPSTATSPTTDGRGATPRPLASRTTRGPMRSGSR